MVSQITFQCKRQVLKRLVFVNETDSVSIENFKEKQLGENIIETVFTVTYLIYKTGYLKLPFKSVAF